jgi:crossover junction endodeoxyribonuclease RuvC
MNIVSDLQKLICLTLFQALAFFIVSFHYSASICMEGLRYEKIFYSPLLFLFIFIYSETLMIGVKTRIIGLDPGLRNTGWGIIDIQSNCLIHIAHGIVHSQSEESFSVRLAQLFRGISEVIEKFSPSEAAVEETFVNKNPLSTLKLGMARGVVLLAPSQQGVHVAEYAANQIKKTVVGVGHAAKDQVAAMVQRLLPSAGKVKLDAADALAAAICHAHFRQSYLLSERKKVERDY